MKKISFKVAKAIKEAGYPLTRFQTVNREQFESGHGYKYSTDKNIYNESPSVLYPGDKDTIDLYYCPTYIESWLWLWREKNLHIYHDNVCDMCFICDENIKDYEHNIIYSESCTDPEEAIVTAIEYLVEHNLIK